MEEISVNEKIQHFRIERLRRDSAYSMPINHFHGYYEIYYLISGERYYFIKNRTYRVHSGELVLVEANQIHKTYEADTEPHERLLIELEEEFIVGLNKFFDQMDLRQALLGKNGVISVTEQEKPYIESLLFGIADDLVYKKPGYDGLLKARLVQLLLYMIRKSDGNSINQNSLNSTQHQKVHEVADYLSSHFDQNIPLDNLSEHFYVSKYYLCRIFKEVTGFTINEYTNLVRVREARKMLLYTDSSMTQIAEKLGFDSVTYFGRVFKTYIFMSPMHFRRFHRQGGVS